MRHPRLTFLLSLVLRRWTKDKNSGENDVDNIVLKGSSVLMTHQKRIIDQPCDMTDWRSDNGYYELDNFTKYSIAYHPSEKCLYANSAHFGWSKVDESDYMDYPRMRIDLARNWPGKEILLTTGGERDSRVSLAASLVDNDHIQVRNDAIPIQFRQSSYKSDHGCVWLSACLLMNTVDRDIAQLMIKRYEEEEGLYEWMDIFDRSKKSRKERSTFSQSNLFQQLRHIKGNQYDLCRVPNVRGKNVTQLILHEKNDGLFVAVISSTDGNCTHAVGIDAGYQLIYDCMEETVLPLNVDNMSMCCGPDRLFNRIEYVCELQKKPQRKRKK